MSKTSIKQLLLDQGFNHWVGEVYKISIDNTGDPKEVRLSLSSSYLTSEFDTTDMWPDFVAEDKDRIYFPVLPSLGDIGVRLVVLNKKTLDRIDIQDLLVNHAQERVYLGFSKDIPLIRAQTEEGKYVFYWREARAAGVGETAEEAMGDFGLGIVNRLIETTQHSKDPISLKSDILILGELRRRQINVSVNYSELNESDISNLITHPETDVTAIVETSWRHENDQGFN